MTLPDPPLWAREHALWRLLNSLLAIVVALNLLWPTSAPLRANGIPLNRYAEYALAAIFMGWLGLLLSFAALRRLDPSAVPPQRFGLVDRCLTTAALLLGVLLLLVRVAAPPEEGFAACYSTPEVPSVPCLFFADGWAPTAAGRVSQVSRLEEEVLFDTEQGYGWRLGAFNDMAFKVSGSDPGTRDARREGFRTRGAHPFAATFAWSTTIGDRLARLYPSGAQIWIAYRGDAALLVGEKVKSWRFSDRERKRVFDVLPDELRSLRLRYANYSCPDAACQTELTMEPLPFADAVFRVSLAPPGASADQAVPLDQRLLAQAEPLLSARRLGPAVEVALVLVALARLAVWMSRISLARRPSMGLIAAAVLLACVLGGLFPAGILNSFAAALESRPRMMLVALVVLPAFLGALGVFAFLLRMWASESGYAFRATVPGRLLLASRALLTPLATVGLMLTCVWLGSLATRSVLGSRPDIPRSVAQFMSLSFVLMTLPVMLGAAGVLVAVVRRRSWAVGTIAPLLLVLASLGLVMQLPTLAVTAPPADLLPAREFNENAGTAWRLPPRDDIKLFSVGDDPLTYSALPKAFLHNPQPENYWLLNTPEQLLTKPFFMYFRAARYALLGDGEIYALALSRALTSWVIAVGGVLVLTVIGALRGVPRMRDVGPRIGTGLLAGLAVLAWIWLSYAVVTVDDFFLHLSQGVALSPALLSFGVLVAARGRNLLLCLVAGTIIAVSVLCRTTNLPLALLGLAIVGVGSGSSVSRWLRASAAYVLPIAAVGMVIWLHAGAPLGVPPEMGPYAAANLGAPYTPLGSYFGGLVPNTLALQITGSALVAIVVALRIPNTISTRVRVGALALAVVFGALLPLFPQRGAPYYPRSLLTAYFAIAFVPLALLVNSWREWLRNVGDDNPESGLRHDKDCEVVVASEDAVIA